MFERGKPRFATTGVIQSLPGFIIDSFWMMIDQNLQGVFQLGNLLAFQLENKQGKLTLAFSSDGENIDLRMDLPFQYEQSFPEAVFAYDDGENQTILLPNEVNA